MCQLFPVFENTETALTLEIDRNWVIYRGQEWRGGLGTGMVTLEPKIGDSPVRLKSEFISP